MHKLVIQDDEGKTTVVPLIKDEITVGRKEGNTIRLTERNVSRKHARIVRSNGTVELEDLNSYNGVRVNGSRIQGRIGLNPSDRVQIGDYVIELRADGANVNADPYEEQKTQPIEKVGPHGPVAQAISMTAIPAAADDAPTTKMPNMTFPGMQPGGNGVMHDALADTDPARQAATVAPTEPMPAQEGAVGRLVILSSNFAGIEYDLSRPSMVIGRTDDNDVVVNHRSISRHHAKIVRENGRYAIVDLQSSNGVRVNGEEYGKVELRRGDVIDLGHVRLRFVEPGEDFVFGRDAQAVPIPTGNNRNLILAIVVILVVVGAGVFALTRGGDGEDDPITPTGDNGTTVENVAENGPDGPDGPDPNDPDDQQVEADDIAPLLAEAEDAIKKNQWDKAIAAATRAEKKDPGNETAKKHLEYATGEKANQQSAEQFNRAATRNRLVEAVGHFKDITEDSVYWREAREQYDELADRDEARKVTAARRVRPPRCGDITTAKGEYENLWEKPSEQLAELERACKARAVALSNRNKPDRPDNGGSETANGDEEGSDPKPSKSVEQLEKEMSDGFSAGQYGAALRSCKSLYKKKRTPLIASRCAVAACKSKRGKEARQYYGALTGRDKAAAYKLCLGEGVELPAP